MNSFKRVLSLLLVTALMLGLCVPVFADGDKTYKKYESYCCLGDGIAAGCGLTRDGSETDFESAISEILGMFRSDYVYLGYDFAQVPNAYHSIVSDTLGAELSQCARSGFRAVELRYMLDGVYNDYDSTYLWGKQFFDIPEEDDGPEYIDETEDISYFIPSDETEEQEEFVLPVEPEEPDEPKEFDLFAALNAIKEESGIVESIEKADVITLNLGMSDVFTSTLVSLLDSLSADFPVLSDISRFLKSTGDIGGAFAKVIDFFATLGRLPFLLNTMNEGFSRAYEQFAVNYSAVLELIKDVNPDADIVLVGIYNPLKNTHLLSFDTRLDMGFYVASTVSKVNGFIQQTAEKYANCFFADISDTDIYRSNLTDSEFRNLSVAKAHPTLAGYAYIAEQILNVLPESIMAPTIKASNNSDTGKVVLKWAKIEGAEKYEVWRATSKNGTYKRIYKTARTTYTDSSSAAGNTYYYKVRAVAGEKMSEFSNIVSRTCDCAKPVVTVKLTSKGSPKLTWQAVSGADKYYVYRAYTKDGDYKKMYTAKGLSYTNSTALAGHKYYYKVVAVSSKTSAANSAYSDVVYKTAK